MGRSGTVGSQPSLEKGEVAGGDGSDQISNQEDQALGGNPPKKKGWGWREALTIEKRNVFLVCFFFRKSFWQNSLLNLRL